jgi:hypothetical protein
MSRSSHVALAVALVAAGGFAACSEDPPVAPAAAHNHMNMTPTADVSALETTPFTFRAPLDPFKIQQLPDFQVHSKATRDIVIQRLIFTGVGIWHFHPGPSFVYVVEGGLTLERFVGAKEGCTETEFQAGQAYVEIAEQVHRVVVPEGQQVVVLVTRLNIPGNDAPFTIPADDPGC